MALKVRQIGVGPYMRNSSYKRFLREDFQYSCVYCTILEFEHGGHHSFQVEHYRPVFHFEHLKFEYSNMLYACNVCNRYKSDDWPSNDPLNDDKGYFDPCIHDYEELFSFSEDGMVTGRHPAAIYMVEKLHLNRPPAVFCRKERTDLQKAISETARLLDMAKADVKRKSTPKRIAICDYLSRTLTNYLRAEELRKAPFDSRRGTGVVV